MHVASLDFDPHDLNRPVGLGHLHRSLRHDRGAIDDHATACGRGVLQSRIGQTNRIGLNGGGQGTEQRQRALRSGPFRKKLAEVSSHGALSIQRV